MTKISPQGVIDRTTSYWRLWVGGTNINFGNLRPKSSSFSIVHCWWCARRSITTARSSPPTTATSCSFRATRIPTCGRATGHWSPTRWTGWLPDLARWFYTLLQRRVITEDGYFYHKYNPDGSPASSWHPWVLKGERAMPIQEDETALVVWAVWRHYYRYRDIEFIRPLWVDVVQKAADFMVRYRDPRTGLPLPSYDLWEERWGVHAFTVATVYGGLKAARNFAVCFGDREKAEVYNTAAEEIKAGAAKYMFSEKLNRFVRRLVPQGQSDSAGFAAL
jgi:glucoamylase